MIFLVDTVEGVDGADEGKQDDGEEEGDAN